MEHRRRQEWRLWLACSSGTHFFPPPDPLTPLSAPRPIPSCLHLRYWGESERDSSGADESDEGAPASDDDADGGDDWGSLPSGSPVPHIPGHGTDSDAEAAIDAEIKATDAAIAANEAIIAANEAALEADEELPMHMSGIIQ